jgi:CHASE1-domain containing sensor protein
VRKPRSLWRRATSSEKPATAWWRARYFWLSTAVAIAGLVASLSAWVAVSHRENELAALGLSSRSYGHALNLQFGINAYLRRVSGLRAFFDTSGNVSRTQFEKITKQLMNDQNAILGMSWIPRVAREQRAAYEQAATRDGIPGYRIKAVAADGSLAPSPEKDEYFPVFYTATEGPGSRVYGLDLNDGGVRQKALERARDNDSLATSPNFTLQSGTGNRGGFFVALPVSRRACPTRRSQTAGAICWALCRPYFRPT